MKYSAKLLLKKQEFKISKRSLARLKAAGISHIFFGSKKYATVTFRGKKLNLHRLLMILAGHKIDGMEVDHKNMNKLDNRLSNLRLATKADNRRNVGARSHNTSGYKGVHAHKSPGRWVAMLRVDGKSVYLGFFDCPVKAAKAYNAAAKKKFGKFAKLNAC